MSSPWEAMRRPPSPRSPAPVPFAKLRAKLGIPDDAPPVDEPITGPLVDGCDAYHAGDDACSGSFRIVEQSGAVWVALCDGCGAEVGVPGGRLDPRVRRDALILRAGLPEKFSGSLERDEHNAPVLKALRQWLDGFDRDASPEDRPASLLPAPALWGLQGRGKSHTLAVACRRVIEECDLPVFYCSVVGLLMDLQRFDSDVIRGQAWERAARVDVLALDDLGAERMTPWRLDQLMHLVDERYQRQLPILVATNYPPSQWERVLDARTVSRLGQMTFTVELRGEDRRQLAMQDSGRSIQAGSGAR